MEKEDGPGCRCVHTLTVVPAVGEEGSPDYIGPRLILFGGATALEGNSATPPSSAGSAGIRLAGATADVHCYDVLSILLQECTLFDIFDCCCRDKIISQIHEMNAKIRKLERLYSARSRNSASQILL